MITGTTIIRIQILNITLLDHIPECGLKRPQVGPQVLPSLLL